MVFELDRADHTDDRVATAPVIDPFDPVADGEFGC
jgi:hypothetical protein